MSLKIFTIYDSKVEAYKTPFFMPHAGDAIRAVADLVADPKTTISKYPADFTLFELGSFCEATGKIVLLPTIKSIAVAHELVKQDSSKLL